MKTKLLALILVAGSSLFGRSHFGFSVGFGYPYAYPHYVPPPAPMVYYAPPAYGVRVYSGPGYYRHYHGHRHYR